MAVLRIDFFFFLKQRTAYEMRIRDWSSDMCSSDLADAYPSASAGMAGKAIDFLTFLETIRTRGGSILKPETVDAMMSVQVRSDNLNQGPGWAFGYGAAVLEDPSRSGTPKSPGTYQWDGAYGHKWFIDPIEHTTGR